MHRDGACAQLKERLMNAIEEQRMLVISCSPGCALEAMMFECPDLTWGRVFCEVDRMGWSGQVRLTA